MSIRAKALVFVDPLSRQLRACADALAGAEAPVLILGETGTGKELLARHVHRQSERGGLFVLVNCAALSPQWGEAELFGHAVGAYPGGAGSRAGWFGSANGGSLYLDEIGDLPLPLQQRLLLVLENREVLRVGSRGPLPVDVRLIAGSSIDLSLAVAAGKFNEGLWRLLDKGRLQLPALRERTADILPLAEYFLGVHAQRLGLPLPQISPEAETALEHHVWYGNTRELENVVHAALLLSPGEVIRPEHLNLPEWGLEHQLAQLAPAERARLRELLGEG